MIKALVSRLPMLIILGTLVASCSEEQPAEGDTKAKAQDADTVYTNGKIYTVNDKQPWAEAMAINNGVFEVIGTNEEAMAAAGEACVYRKLNAGWMVTLHV